MSNFYDILRHRRTHLDFLMIIDEISPLIIAELKTSILVIEQPAKGDIYEYKAP